MYVSIIEFDINWVLCDYYWEILVFIVVVVCKGRVNIVDKYNILLDLLKYLILKNIFIIEFFEYINI